MAKVVIGSRTLTNDPQTMTVVRADKQCASVQTYSNVAFFTWGTSIIGKEITLGWPFMTAAEFDALDTIFKADVAFVFNPNDGCSHTYNVNMTALDGDYLVGRTLSAPSTRKNVKMTLLIMSVAT